MIRPETNHKFKLQRHQCRGAAIYSELAAVPHMMHRADAANVHDKMGPWMPSKLSGMADYNT